MKWSYNAKTVGEAIEALKNFPLDTLINQGFTDSVDIVLFNRNEENQHMSFEEGGDWTDEYEEDKTNDK